MYIVMSVIKTYAWMQATADSSTARSSGATDIKISIEVGRFVNKLPNSVIKRWPAIRLAVNRTQSVIGRIMFLANSINTMKFIKAFGVPCGTKWDSIWLVLFIQPLIIKVNQNANDNGRFTAMWEVKEKFCGKRAIIFVIKMVEKIPKIITSVLFSVLFKVNLTSFFKVLVIKLKTFICVGLIHHKGGLIRRAVNRTTNQAKENKVELGSNVENRLLIILLFFLLI